MPANQRLFSVTSWLLKAASVLVVLLAGLLALVFIALVLGLGALLFAPDLLKPLDLPMVLHGVTLVRAVVAGLFAVAGGLISLILILMMIRATTGIVDTAIAGDPFVGENAERLNLIGWLLLGLMAVQFATYLAVAIVAPHGDPNINISGGSEPDPIGLMAILLIFVLARIFRHGSDMRDELESMV
jgi:uncharacterized membrane protein